MDQLDEDIIEIQRKIQQLEQILKERKAQQTQNKQNQQQNAKSNIAKINQLLQPQLKPAHSEKKAKRLADIRAICFGILYDLEPDTAKQLEEELEEKKQEKLRHEEFEKRFRMISEARKTISSDEHKKRVQNQLDQELANRLTADDQHRYKPVPAPKSGPSHSLHQPATESAQDEDAFTKMKYIELMAAMENPDVDTHTLQMCCEELQRRIVVYANVKSRRTETISPTTSIHHYNAFIDES